MDIVKRLRQEIAGYTDGPIEAAEATMHEAAEEIERLRNKVQWLEMCETTVVKQDNEIERLREKYEEAIDDIEEWGAYAPEYFQEKWKLKECIEQHRAALKEGE